DADDGRVAVLLRVAGADLPKAVPEDWRIIRTSSSEAVVLALVPSWIDWTHYTVCRPRRGGGDQEGVDAGLFDRSRNGCTIKVDGMPDVQSIGPHEELVLRFPLRTAPPGEIHEVFMPRDPVEMCGGHIVSVPAGSRIHDGGRRATLISGPATTAAPE